MVASLILSAALTLGQTDSEPPPPAPTADRWELMKLLQGTWYGSLLDDNRISVSGWTEASFNASSDRGSNLPLGFDYRANQFLLQQNWVRIDRSVVTSGTSDPTFGFRSDWILPGTDYSYTVARGLLDRQLTANNGGPNVYGIDPVQFYAEAYIPTVGQGLDLKLGRFVSPYGVESVAAVDNAFWSHSYTDVYNPFTNTGILATQKLTNTWTVQSGLATGSDVFFGPEATPTYVGSVKWAPPDGNDSAMFSVIAGCGRYNQERQFNNPEVFDFVYTHQATARLSYTLETLYGFTTNVPDIGFADWLGVVNYLNYTLTAQLSANARLEFFDDAQGQRTGSRGLYDALSLDLNYRPCRSLILRPEIRFDYNDQSRPFQGHAGLFTTGLDAIVRW